MIIKFKFADGTVSEVEVDEELGLVISAMEREEQSYERKMRRWCPIKLDEAEYEGEWFADNNTPEKAYELDKENLDAKNALRSIYYQLGNEEKLNAIENQ